MKKKTLLVVFSFLIAGIIGFYFLNKRYKIIDLSSISVSTDASLSKSKVKIKKGFYSINRDNDQELFSNNYDRTVYKGRQVWLLGTDYGENDFLIIYDDKYYFQFRHFIFNNNNQHSYRFALSRQQGTIYVEADIKGQDQMSFKRPMHLVADAKFLRCNVPIDSSKIIYNMTELEAR